MNESDVIVVGSGQAGAPLATRLARGGRSVVLMERGHLGGTCVNYGCTPTKAMIGAAQAAHEARRASEMGVEVGTVSVDLDAVVDRKDEIVRQWRASVERNVEGAGDALTLVRGHARFVEPGVLEAGDERYAAPTIVLNVGGRPRVPPIPGLEDVEWLDNASVMELRRLPDHLLVVGGGYIGCEFGQAFRRFGAEVTIVEASPHVLGREDEDVAGALEDALRQEGLTLRTGVRATSVERAEPGIRLHLSDGDAVEGTHLLLAAGRRPNTDDLGLDAGGVERDEDGFVAVDRRYRTSAEGVYAVGDCTGGPQFTHSSWDDHRILFDLLHGDDRRTRDDRLVPHAVFTDPQVGRVGLSEDEAREREVRYEAATMPFSRIARAVEIGKEPGMVKVLVSPEDHRILGAAVVGDQGGELVHVFSVLMQAGAPATSLVDAEMAHPTYAEGLQTAVMTLERHALS